MPNWPCWPQYENMWLLIPDSFLVGAYTASDNTRAEEVWPHETEVEEVIL